MKLSGTTGTVLMLVALAAVGAGAYFFKTSQMTRQLTLQAQTKQNQLKAKEAEQKAREAEARTAEAEKLQKESELKIKAAEEAKAASELAAKKQEAENLKAQKAADEAAAEKAAAAQAAAEAETEKAAAQKAAADAARAETEKKIELEQLALKRAEAERAKAEAEAVRLEAAKKIADAALEKSANELKAAEANAQAERDRKLRMYRRAETSRAEMLALQRAERLLALDEAGALTAADLETAGEDDPPGAEAAAGGAPKTNAVVKVDWPEANDQGTPAEAKVNEISQKLGAQSSADARRRMRDYIRTFDALAERATAEGRAADAAHFRRTLVELVPDYVEAYATLIDETRQAKDREKDAGRLVTNLLALVPDWQRISVCEKLLLRDEAYYSKALAGRIDRDEYVKVFRKLYEQARRDKDDRDERRAKMAHLCEVLSIYVPEFEKSPEWK